MAPEMAPPTDPPERGRQPCTLGRGQEARVRMASREQGLTNVAKDTQDTQTGSGVVVRRTGQNGNLLAHDHGTSAEGEEDLAHDDEADVHVRLSEIDQQARTEDVDGDKHPEEPLEVARLPDTDTDTDEPDARYDVPCAVDVSGLRDRNVKHDLEERGEIRLVAVGRDLVRDIEEAGAEDRARDEEVERDNGFGRDPSLADAKRQEHYQSDNEHGNDVAGRPAVRSRRGDGEGNEEERETPREEEHSEHCER